MAWRRKWLGASERFVAGVLGARGRPLWGARRASFSGVRDGAARSISLLRACHGRARRVRWRVGSGRRSGGEEAWFWARPVGASAYGSAVRHCRRRTGERGSSRRDSSGCAMAQWARMCRGVLDCRWRCETRDPSRSRSRAVGAGPARAFHRIAQRAGARGKSGPIPWRGGAELRCRWKRRPPFDAPVRAVAKAEEIG